MPPCYRVLLQQIKRTKYITSIWGNATRAFPTALTPTDFGWYLKDEKYVPLWFEGDQSPSDIEQILYSNEIHTNENTDSDNELSENSENSEDSDDDSDCFE